MDMLEPSRFLFASLLVLGLIGCLYMGLRYAVATGRLRPLPGPGAGRLEVLETCPLDARRRLVLVRRDNAQHLLLLADGREMLVESHIPGAPHA